MTRPSRNPTGRPSRFPGVAIVRRTLRLPVSVWEALEGEAKARGCSVAHVIVQLVAEHLKESR